MGADRALWKRIKARIERRAAYDAFVAQFGEEAAREVERKSDDVLPSGARIDWAQEARARAEDQPK